MLSLHKDEEEDSVANETWPSVGKCFFCHGRFSMFEYPIEIDSR